MVPFFFDPQPYGCVSRTRNGSGHPKKDGGLSNHLILHGNPIHHLQTACERAGISIHSRIHVRQSFSTTMTATRQRRPTKQTRLGPSDFSWYPRDLQTVVIHSSVLTGVDIIPQKRGYLECSAFPNCNVAHHVSQSLKPTATCAIKPPNRGPLKGVCGVSCFQHHPTGSPLFSDPPSPSKWRYKEERPFVEPVASSRSAGLWGFGAPAATPAAAPAAG